MFIYKKKIFKRSFFVAAGLLLLFAGKQVDAQNEMSATVPEIMTVNEAFNFTISGEVQGKIVMPAMNDIRIVGGPSQMISHQSSNVNGKVQNITKVSYTYFLMVSREGEYEIPPVQISSDGKVYRTNSVIFKAVKGSNSAGSENQSESSKSNNSEPEPVLLRLTTSDHEIFAGEQIVLETKVFVRERLNINGLNMPSFEGFWVESLEPDQIASQDIVNGLNYRTQVIQRNLLTAQKTGEIIIEPAEIDVTIRKRVQRQRPSNPFDSFFDDPFDSYQSVPAKFLSNKTKINVKPLPSNAPDEFKGSVGTFKMRASVNNDSIENNEAITMVINISGKGNLNLIQAPDVDYPPDLEVFEPKISKNIDHTTSGSSGSVTFEYLMIPRLAGSYRIAPVKFSYFDPAEQTYKNETSKEFVFYVSATGDTSEEVSGSPVNTLFRDDVKNIATDIRFIKTANPGFKRSSSYLIHSNLKYIFPLGILLLLILLIIKKIYIKHNADILTVRSRKARKMAMKRLKNARGFMENEDEKIYEEILKALWGYLADKLSIHQSELSKEKVSSLLHEFHYPEENINELWDIIDAAELSRYSPEKTQDMKSLYKNAENCISDLEQSTFKEKK